MSVDTPLLPKNVGHIRLMSLSHDRSATKCEVQMRTIRYEVKDATRNYWWIIAQEGERAYEDPNDKEYYRTQWHFHVSFEVEVDAENKDVMFCDTLFEQYDWIPEPHDFMRLYHDRVTSVLVQASIGGANIITREIK